MPPTLFRDLWFLLDEVNLHSVASDCRGVVDLVRGEPNCLFVDTLRLTVRLVGLGCLGSRTWRTKLYSMLPAQGESNMHH
jgi:hypothetical protein